MLKFQEKKKFRKIINSKIIIFILIVINVFLFNAVFNIYRKKIITKNNLLKTVSTFNNLDKREQLLLSEIERLKTDFGVEEEIRDRYGMVKDNENLITIVDTRKSNLNQKDKNKGFWQFFLDWFR